MFCVNDDMSIYVTRGDTAAFRVTADDNGTSYIFQPGDVVRFKVTEKKACENVMFYKDFPVTEEIAGVQISLTKEDTKFGDVISKPTDYWYEIELNPFTNPQTIIGYDDDGPKVFKLFPEGDDVESEPIEPEDIPVVDDELDLTSTRPVENQAISRAIVSIQGSLKDIVEKFDSAITISEEGNVFKGSADKLGGHKASEYVKKEEFDEACTALKKSVSDGKAEVAAAITEKKVETATDATFAEIVANIRQITLGSGNALPENVDDGITFTNDGGIELVGTSMAKADYAEYVNAVVEGLQYSGLGVTEDTEAEVLQSILENRFPQIYDVLSWMITGEGSGYTTTSNAYFDGSVVGNEEDMNMVIICSSNAEQTANVTVKGADMYDFGTSYRLSFNAEFEMGSGVGQGEGTFTISVCNADGVIDSYTRTGIVNNGSHISTLDFESEGEWWVEMKMSVITHYTDAKLTINSMTAETLSQDEKNVYAELSNVLNSYTGQTKTMTLEEIVNKIDGILSEISSNKTRARNFYSYCKTITEIRNPLDFSDVEDFYAMFMNCYELIYVSALNTGKGKDFTNLFNGCSKLVTVESIDVSNTSMITRLKSAFYKCNALENITFVGTIPADLDMSDCVNLTYASLMNIINALTDYSTDTSTTHSLALGTTNQAKLTDAEKAIATEKGWTLS